MNGISSAGGLAGSLQSNGYYGSAVANTYSAAGTNASNSGQQDGSPVLSLVTHEMWQDAPFIDAVTIELRMPTPGADNHILDVRA
jgi:hypothetical protein